ncbi:hypothetical protein M758_6G106100 [Ceratodon purpureus]|nr:hypothetical protein M758_6G106100 [Ceratodon purpureus]
MRLARAGRERVRRFGSRVAHGCAWPALAPATMSKSSKFSHFSRGMHQRTHDNFNVCVCITKTWIKWLVG